MKRYRMLAAVLAAVLAAGMLAGCGGTGAKNPEEPGRISDEGDSGAVPGLRKYDEPVTLTTFLSSSDSLERDLAMTEDGETVEDNRYTRWFKEALNIELSYKWIAKSDTYDTKLNLAISSRQYADVMLVTAEQAQQLYKAGKILGMSEIYEKYATEETKEAMSSDAASEDIFSAVTFDGELYGIPKMWSSYDSAQFLWVRTDWLEKYNLPEPNTMEDVIAIAKRFAAEDPDGNGEKDTMGIGFVSAADAAMGGLTGFFNGYHSYLNLFLEKDGSLQFSNFLPESKKALAALQELYRAGAISREYATTDHEALSEAIIAGKCGMFYGQHWMPLNPFTDAVSLDDSAVWKAYPIPSCDDTPASVQLTTGVTSWWVVSKDCANPEAVLKMINLLYSTPESEMPEYVTREDVSNYYAFNPMLVQDPQVNIKQMKSFKAYLNGEEIDTTKDGVDIKIRQYEAYKAGNENFWWVDQIYGIEGCPIEILNDRYIGEKLMVTNQFHGVSTATMIKNSATLAKLVDQTLVEIITGAKDVSEWDLLEQRWLSLGGQKILDEVNAQ